MKTEHSDTKNNDVPLTKNDDAYSSSPAVLPTPGVKAPYICNGITKDYAHILLGHVHFRSAMTTIEYLKFRVCHDPLKCRQVIACEGCARGKSRKQGVNLRNTSTHVKSTDANAFVHLDISTLRKAGNKPVRNNVWVALIDEYSGMATTLFVASNRAMIEATCELLNEWKLKGTAVNVIRCDNGTENTALVKRAKSADWQLGIQFQFTSVHTPQFNALVEFFFETVYNRAGATIIYSNIPDSVKYLVCKHLILHLTHLFNLEVVEKNNIPATWCEWWGLSLPKFVPYLRPWGEAGIVHVKDTTTGKRDARGVKMMYVGASMHHSGDTYLMFHPLTSRIHKTRDVEFTQKMYYRQDASISSDQPHPLDTSFFDMQLIQDIDPVSPSDPPSHQLTMTIHPPLMVPAAPLPCPHSSLVMMNLSRLFPLLILMMATKACGILYPLLSSSLIL